MYIYTLGLYLWCKLYLPVGWTETGSDDDALDMSDDDFFLTGSSSDEAQADDEWTDKSTRYALFFFVY